MRTPLLLLVALLAISACSAHRTAGPAAAPSEYKGFHRIEVLEPVAGLSIYHYRNDASGLELLVSPKPGTGTVAIVTAYEVGARFELNGRTGLAHLFEHMMFRGTEHFPKPFETLSDWGGRFNAYTTPDLTVYHELVPKERFNDALDFESERMRKLRLTPEVFDTERGAVVSERKMRTEDSPSGRLFWELYQFAYDRHPYKTAPIGWQKDLDATKFQDALDFYNRFYAPNRAVVSLVGDLTVSEALEQMDRYYGSMTRSSFEEPAIAVEPARQGIRRKVVPMKTESVILADAIFGATYNDPNAATDSLIASLLADDKLGYLSDQLVERGLARGVGSDAGANIDPGLSIVLVTGNPGVPVARLEQAYDSARKKFPSWLTAERLDNFKLYYLAEQWESMRDPMHLAEGMAAAHAATGNAAWDFQFLARVQKVTLEEIRERLKYWDTSARTRVILTPAARNAPLERSK
ncbi:MAG TPA: pitrilysin family protein [Candidatus Limnocylindrales bacterium]|nr:pitrilysin family protein [Candidatus Limnocylindrales bacterium]